VPWSISLASYVCDWALILALRIYLQRENKRRDAIQAASGKPDDEFGYVEKTDASGKVIRQKVEKALLDITVSFSVSCFLFGIEFSRVTEPISFTYLSGSRKYVVPLCAVMGLTCVASFGHIVFERLVLAIIVCFHKCLF
jgi:hypothetical protein